MTGAERFEALCKRDMETLHPRESIGTYKEKRLHRILKSYVCENKASFEIPVGNYVADIYEDGRITEIQTCRFDRLLPKLEYYLSDTDLSVTVVCPIIRNKRLIRIDPETGEILRQKLSPSHGKAADLLPELYHIRQVIPNDRLKIKLMLIDAEEYRYSERVRYRRSGAYDSELFPTALVEERDLSSVDDFLEFIPKTTDSFDATEYSKFIRQKGRDLYSSLNLLCHLKLLAKEKQGRKNIYKAGD